MFISIDFFIGQAGSPVKQYGYMLAGPFFNNPYVCCLLWQELPGDLRARLGELGYDARSLASFILMLDRERHFIKGDSPYRVNLAPGFALQLSQLEAVPTARAS